MRIKVLFLLSQLLAISLPAANIRFEQSDKSIDRFDFVEVTLSVSNAPAGNPFIEAEVVGEFAHEGDTPVRVDGFCDSDDGSLFRIRFMPAKAGKHTYSVTYKAVGEEQRHTGTFAARAGRRKGMVRVDKEHPTHFVWEGTGDHFFYNGTTAYWLLGFTDERVIRESIDRLARLKVTRIRSALSARTTSGMRWKEPMVVSDDAFQFRLEPWPAARPHDIQNPGYDVTRFNLEHFRKAERMLAHANKRDLQVSLIFALDVADKGVDPFKGNTGNVDEQRYYRYCIARFAAFANVWWDVVNEWNLCRNEPWVAKMGALVKEADPYDHVTSVHGTSRFPFGNQPWVDYVIFQSWDEHGAYDFMLKARQAQTATGRPLPIVNEEYGYEDHYPYPWGEKRIWPARIAETRVRLAWEMTMAGGYQTTGERANIAGMGGWITGRGNNAMTMLEGYGRLRSFFEKFEWWKLEPHPELVTGESKALPVAEKGERLAAALCLAEPGHRYVIYLRQGGTATVQLAEGRYAVERFDPSSGKSQTMKPVMVEKSWTTPAVTDTEPWVFLVERR
ncbi:MAG TPA: DUF5060 domain-containing protein [Verrucomicrobiae bacterium]|nr:DUF5060 domain-containing protein [Verrucomicrobiae bacterium]